MGADEIRALLSQLTAAPDDVALRTRAAEELEAARTDAAAARADIDAVLAPLTNLVGHDDDTGLPCLCRDCLPRAGTRATADGNEWMRSFVVVGTRVLHFWMLAEQARKKGVAASVRASVRARLTQRLARKPRRGGKS